MASVWDTHSYWGDSAGLRTCTYRAEVYTASKECTFVLRFVCICVYTLECVLLCPEQAGRSVVAHHLSIPEARDLDEYISQDGWHNYSCILQLSPAPGEGAGLECEIGLRTVMGRILPKCSLQRGQRSTCRC